MRNSSMMLHGIKNIRVEKAEYHPADDGELGYYSIDIRLDDFTITVFPEDDYTLTLEDKP